MEPYPSGQFGFIDDPDRKFANGSVWTRTRTQSDSPEPLLPLAKVDAKMSKMAGNVGQPIGRNWSHRHVPLQPRLSSHQLSGYTRMWQN